MDTVVFKDIKTPSYVIDENKLIHNLKILNGVEKETGCHILLAQKAFSAYAMYPLIGQYISGTTASGLYEARLGKEEMNKENHVFAPAYKQEDMDELVKICDHIIFNSVNQLKKYKKQCLKAGVSIGLRINPEVSTQGEHAIYDPCAEGSRLGVTLKALNKGIDEDEQLLEGVDGLHFHTLCEQDSDDLETTLAAVERSFGDILPQMKWLNMGGGHHITRNDYDIARLEKCITYAQDQWNLCVYLEPGEAVALNAGYLITRVLDIVENNATHIAILDTSAACHMPDVIEMPYMPPLYGAKALTDKSATNADSTHPDFVYRLAGPTCLAGDVIGDYTFAAPLHEGSLLVFQDMAIYSTCKNNTFNGMPLPDIYKMQTDGAFVKLTDFGYSDFKMRLGKYR